MSEWMTTGEEEGGGRKQEYRFVFLHKNIYKQQKNRERRKIFSYQKKFKSLIISVPGFFILCVGILAHNI